MEYSKIDNVQIADVDPSDYPDFSDAYVESADYDGEEMTEDQLEELNEDREFVNDAAHDSLF
jgi:hypothetical protein